MEKSGESYEPKYKKQKKSRKIEQTLKYKDFFEGIENRTRYIKRSSQTSTYQVFCFQTGAT